MEYINHKEVHLDLDPNEPLKNNLLDRNKFCHFLTNIVSNYSQGFVLAINGEWGTGKTVFIHQWEAHLKKHGFYATTLNAWDNDFFEKPTLAILSQLWTLLDGHQTNSATLISALESIKKVPSILLKGAVEKQLSNFLSDNGISSLKKTLIEDKENGILYRYSDIENYVNDRADFLNYRNALSNFGKAIYEDSGRPLVFIIDELDRCTPTYAVHILEKVKHLFNVPNIVFAFSVDKSQLKNTIQGYFGSSNFNGEEYLRRFFDIDLTLPAIPYRPFCMHLSDHYNLKSYLNDDDLHEFIRITQEAGEAQQLTLRQLEKFYAHAKLMFSFFNSSKIASIIAILLLLQKFAPHLYASIEDKRYSIEEFALLLKPYFSFSDGNTGPGYLGTFLYHLNNYLLGDRRFFPEDNFKLSLNDEFVHEHQDIVNRCFIAASRTNKFGMTPFPISQGLELLKFAKQVIARP